MNDYENTRAPSFSSSDAQAAAWKGSGANERIDCGLRGGRLRQDRRPGRRGRLAAPGPRPPRHSSAPSSCRSTAAAARPATPRSRPTHASTCPIGARTVRRPALALAACPDSDVPVYLVEQTDYFDRDDPRQGRGLYQFTLPDGRRPTTPITASGSSSSAGPSWKRSGCSTFWPDVLHANDWQTGLVPVYLPRGYAPPARTATALRPGPHAVHDPQHRLPGAVLALGHGADRPRLEAVQPAAAASSTASSTSSRPASSSPTCSTPSARPTPGRSRRPTTAAACKAS